MEAGWLPGASGEYRNIQQGRHDLRKVAGFIGATVGGAAGWWLGARFGVMTAFVLSMVGTGVGIYLVRRWLSEYLP